MDDFPKKPESGETPLSPQAFTLAAVLFEAFLAGIAASVGYLLSYPVSKTFVLSWADFGIGLGGAAPLILIVLFVAYLPLPPFQKLCRLMDELIVPRFRGCHMLDLLAISITAGIGEEMLFRGLIQGYLSDSIGGPFGIWVGLIAASVLFAAMHPMTLTYALIAGAISLCLGGAWVLTGNLLVPITAHATYDFVVLLYLVRFRRFGVEEFQ